MVETVIAIVFDKILSAQSEFTQWHANQFIVHKTFIWNERNALL